MAVRAERPRRHHPLAGAGALCRARTAKPAASLIECRLETGRTHQIRVHLAHAGHPLLGDATYGTGLQDQGEPPAGRRRRTPWRVLEDRPCMLIYWPLNTRSQGKGWSSDRNCRPISSVYITAWPPVDRARISVKSLTFQGVDRVRQRLIRGSRWCEGGFSSFRPIWFGICCTAIGIRGRSMKCRRLGERRHTSPAG